MTDPRRSKLLEVDISAASLLTSGKEEKNSISPSKLNFAVSGGQMGIYTLQKPHSESLVSNPVQTVLNYFGLAGP